MIISPVLLQSPVAHLTIRHTLQKDKPSLCSYLPVLSTRRTVTVNPPLSLEYPAHPTTQRRTERLRRSSFTLTTGLPKLWCRRQAILGRSPRARLQSRPAVFQKQDGFEN